MTLFKLRSAPFILIEDSIDKNIIPLVRDLLEQDTYELKLFCYEQPVSLWRNVFKDFVTVTYYEELDPEHKYTDSKCSIMIDSVNQMSLTLGWNECLKCIKKLLTDSNVGKLLLILHRDCLPFSKLQIHLHHLASAVVSFESEENKIKVKLKKGGKLVRSEEKLSYDPKMCTLKSTPIIKEVEKEEQDEKPSPANLSTFKIEVDQTEKLEKYKLTLPYMSKINEGQSKVYYEPDAVDDWDEEDPDEDLDI